MRRALQLAARAVCAQQAPPAAALQPCIAACSWQQQQLHSHQQQQPLIWRSGRRGYSQEAAEQQQDDDVSDKVKQLAADIMGLSVLECSQLSRVLRDKLGVPRGSGMPMMPMMAAAAPAAAPAAGGGGAAAEAAAEEKAEKTEFDVKLESFSPEGKIKVIKEIRALTNLGLKEAKELVEKAPVVVKAKVSKADADAMKKQLEAVGGKVAVE